MPTNINKPQILNTQTNAHNGNELDIQGRSMMTNTSLPYMAPTGTHSFANAALNQAMGSIATTIQAYAKGGASQRKYGHRTDGKGQP